MSTDSYLDSLDYAHDDGRDVCIEHDVELTDAGECRECEREERIEASREARAALAEQAAELLAEFDALACDISDADDGGDDVDAFVDARAIAEKLALLMRGELRRAEATAPVLVIGLDAVRT